VCGWPFISGEVYAGRVILGLRRALLIEVATHVMMVIGNTANRACQLSSFALRIIPEVILRLGLMEKVGQIPMCQFGWDLIKGHYPYDA